MPRNVGQNSAIRRALPAHTLRWLDVLPSKSRPDAHLFSIVLSMVNFGIPEEEGYGMLLDPSRPGGIALQKRHQGNPLRPGSGFRGSGSHRGRRAAPLQAWPLRRGP